MYKQLAKFNAQVQSTMLEIVHFHYKANSLSLLLETGDFRADRKAF